MFRIKVNSINLNLLSLLLLFPFKLYSEAIQTDQQTNYPFKDIGLENLIRITSSGLLLSIDMKSGEKNKPSVTTGLIKAPLEKVWTYIINIEDYPSLIPTVERAEVLEVEDETETVYFKLRILQIGPIKITTDYTVKYTFQKDKNRILVDWVSGKVKDIKGSFLFLPVNENRETLFFYIISGDYKDAAFGSSFLFSQLPELEPTMAMGAGIVVIGSMKRAIEQTIEWKQIDFSTKEIGLNAISKVLSNGPTFFIDKTDELPNEPVTTSILIDAPFDTVWDTMIEIERYPGWAALYDDIKILERCSNSITATFDITYLKIGFIRVGTKSTFRYRFEKPKILIESIADGIKNGRGWWEFLPVDNGKKTVAIYKFSADWAASIPGLSFLFGRQPELQPLLSIMNGLAITETLKAEAERSNNTR